MKKWPVMPEPGEAKSLVFIAGKRKAGTTFLFHSLQADYTPGLKDRSWDETRAQISTFLASDARTGLIAKADALDDPDLLVGALQAAGCSGENTHIIVLDRNKYDRFLSYFAHDRKMKRRSVNMIKQGFNEEEKRADEALAALRKSAFPVTVLDYDDVVSKTSPPTTIAGLSYVPTQSRGNARADVLPFFGLISRIVEQPWYARVRDGKLLMGLKTFYYRMLAGKQQRKNGFVRCLVLGSIAGPVDGQRRITGMFPEKTDFTVKVMDFNGHRGRLGPFRIFLQTLKAVLLGLTGKIDVVYLAISRTRFGLLRDWLLLTPVRLSGARVVAHVHGAEFEDFYFRDPSWSGLKTRQLGQIDRFLFIHETLVPDQSDIRARSHVLRNPLPRFAQSHLAERHVGAERDGSARPVFGFISSFVPGKGLEDFIALADTFGARARFQVAGGVHPKYVSYGEDMLARVSGHASIVYLGYLTDPTQFYTTTDVFVFPTAYVSEALPGVVLEALAFGCLGVVRRTNLLPSIFADAPIQWFETSQELEAAVAQILETGPDEILSAQITGTNWVRAGFPSEDQWVQDLEKHLLEWSDCLDDQESFPAKPRV